MSKNFRAFITSSLPPVSDFLRFFGVDTEEEPVAKLVASVIGLLLLDFFDSALGRLRDFFLVEEGWVG